jgi:predicted GIY-YIG superfamily endonuclease
MNKQETKEYYQKRYAANKEEYKETYKRFKSNNPTYTKNQNAKWNVENRDKIKAYNFEKNNKDKDGKYRVYMLEDNYVGVTLNTSRRLSEHRSKRKYTGNFMCILHTTECKDDASEMEELLHDIGYKGKHKHNMNYA